MPLHFLSLSLGVCLYNPYEAPPDQSSYIFGCQENLKNVMAILRPISLIKLFP